LTFVARHAGIGLVQTTRLVIGRASQHATMGDSGC
jgi:hypothetical protein